MSTALSLVAPARPARPPAQQVGRGRLVLINLGCGHVQPDGWVNVDGSLRAWTASRLAWLDGLLTRLRLLPRTEFSPKTYFANLLKPLPWEDGSADAVYLGEVLEHFTRDDGRRLLQECFRVLRPEGVIRVRVPDNARFWENYLSEYAAARARPRSEWGPEHTRWVEMFFRDICVRRRLLGSFGHYHKWMYDEVSLTLTLESVGFRDVRRRQLYDSSIPGIRDVETRDDLTVEAIKPARSPEAPAGPAPDHRPFSLRPRPQVLQ